MRAKRVHGSDSLSCFEPGNVGPFSTSQGCMLLYVFIIRNQPLRNRSGNYSWAFK